MTRTVNTYNKKLSLIFIIVFVITLSGLVIGCGGDDNELDLLYKELVGTYDLFRAEVTYVGQPKQVLESPAVSGAMTISSN